ncbi:MAG: glycosyltransferase family 2 protein [Candidatus Aenigmarchaeota archaeon]|nr:glycosyltransferase family 2 protein [Candidatus Aenigmarchaeota archaeon]
MADIAALVGAGFTAVYAAMLLCMLVPYEPRRRAGRPTFSVLIANAEKGRILRKTLAAIRAADYPQRSIEIIVIDSTGEKDVARAARTYRAKICRDTRCSGKGAALNIGIRKAGNEVLYFLDADTTPERGAFAAIASSLSDETPVVVGITIGTNKGGMAPLLARLELVLLPVANYLFSRVFMTAGIGGRNFAIYRKRLMHLGGFRHGLTEDINLNHRLFHSKSRILYHPGVRGSELVPSELGHMFRQHERWVRGCIGEVGKAGRTDLMSVILMFPVVVTVVYFYAFIPLLAALFFFTGNALALAGVAAAMLIAMYQAARYLTAAETIGAPFIASLLALFSIGVVLVVLAKMALGIPISWYKTPKK